MVIDQKKCLNVKTVMLNPGHLLNIPKNKKNKKLMLKRKLFTILIY
jgi:hypothetical protein